MKNITDNRNRNLPHEINSTSNCQLLVSWQSTLKQALCRWDKERQPCLKHEKRTISNEICTIIKAVTNDSDFFRKMINGM